MINTGSEQDVSAVPANVLASRIQGKVSYPSCVQNLTSKFWKQFFEINIEMNVTWKKTFIRPMITTNMHRCPPRPTRWWSWWTWWRGGGRGRTTALSSWSARTGSGGKEYIEIIINHHKYLQLWQEYICLIWFHNSTRPEVQMFCPCNPDKTLTLFICRSGVYCAANACIEQVIQHGEVITQCQSINAHTSHVRLTCSRQSRQSGGTGPSLFRTWYDIKFILIN